jgi:hypothetical protein
VISETKVFSYHVDDDSNVTAKVTIGNGQAGGWAIILGGKVKKKGSKPVDVPIGKGSTLRGKHMTVSSAVIDVRTQTDRLSVTTRIRGGTKSMTCKHSKTGRQGETASYTTIVFFV